MGAPSWTASPQPDKYRFRHLIWMYRVGALIGWMDDLVDLNEDRKNNCTNGYLLSWKESSVPEEVLLKEAANHIIRDSVDIVQSWKDLFQSGTPNKASGFFYTTLISWTGGI